MVLAEEVVQHALHLADQAARGRSVLLGRKAIRVSAAHDIADAVFVAVDGELVGHGQGTALVADIGELLQVAKGPARGPFRCFQ